MFGLGACGATPAPPDWASQIREANDVLLNEGNVDMVPEFFATTFVAHVTGGDMQGREGIVEFLTAIREAFPDLQVEVEILVTEGDRVAWLRTNRGTHEGDFMGVTASGRQLVWQDLIVTRYEGGMIAEEWGESGLAGVLYAP
jgi:predicted ester cyclase